ncbi:MAG: hypothetical protein MI861_23390 [Pirellulales bacterium]|nr:hypothetical protein [Pirellulales bacterium]
MNWQSIVAWFIVTLAAAWLVRRVGRTVRAGLRGDPASGNCGNCARNPNTSVEPSLVNLEDTSKSS